MPDEKPPTLTTEIQMAFLKLAAFKAIADARWGVTKVEKVGDIEMPTHIPWEWQRCLDKADELTIWALTDPPKTGSADV